MGVREATQAVQRGQQMVRDDRQRRALSQFGDMVGGMAQQQADQQRAGLQAGAQLGAQMFTPFGMGAAAAGQMQEPNVIGKQDLMAQMAKVDPMAAYQQMTAQPDEAPQQRNVRELTQVWKDLERSLRNARETGDTGFIEQYTPVQKNVENQLSSLAPEIWGAQPQQQGQMQGQQPVPQQEVDFSAPNQILASAQDANKDGIIDNVAGMKAQLRDWARQNGVATTDPRYQDLLANVQDLEDQFSSQYRAGLAKEEKGYQRSEARRKERQGQVGEFEWLWAPHEALANAPTDSRAKAMAIQAALRKRSGAAIAASEFLGALEKLLPSDKRKQLLDELGGVEGFMANLTGSEEQYLTSTMDKYMEDVDTDLILSQYIGPSVAAYYKYQDKYGQKKGKPTKKGEPIKKKTSESTLDRIRRLKKQRGAK